MYLGCASAGETSPPPAPLSLAGRGGGEEPPEQVPSPAPPFSPEEKGPGSEGYVEASNKPSPRPDQEGAPGGEVTEILRLRTAPFGEHPFAAVHAPRSLKHLAETPIVIFFHGWYGCLKVLLGPDPAPCRHDKPTRHAMDLVSQFNAAGVDALLVVPQLAFDQASSAPGGFFQKGRLGAMLAEILAHPRLTSHLPVGAKPGRVVLIAHSGAYMALGKALGQGGVDVHEVWMMDAHYLDVPELAPWFRSHLEEFLAGRRRMAFLYTEGEKTGTRTLRLLEELTAGMNEEERSRVLWRGEHPEVAPAEALSRPLVAQQTGVSHEKIPRVFLVPMLRTAQLPGGHQGR
ncbi:MAG: hypothetical protein RMJ98_17975 [Myxococcales bacterium]|nr:hypothetical protein [Polyangiaceae bacterium]MDW8251186.1 hypothetical protein [Myxococcales bacterium]